MLIVTLLMGGLTLVAESSKALMEWTPTTFYIAAGVVDTVVIWVGMQLFGADPEYNTIPAAMAAAAVGNVAAFFLKDHGVVGVTATAGIWVFLLMITSGMDIFRTIIAFILVMGTYAGLGQFIAARTPLTAYDIGGVPKVTMTGGFEPEPIKRPDAKTPDKIEE
ncbi:MAG: hypothetical protein ABEN55_15155 [Bradymonadaceae bacterium]